MFFKLTFKNDKITFFFILLILISSKRFKINIFDCILCNPDLSFFITRNERLILQYDLIINSYSS